MKIATVLQSLILLGDVLVMSKLPPVSITTTPLDNFTLGNSASLWMSIASGTFYNLYLVGTLPNGTAELYCRGGFFIAENATLDSDGSISFQTQTNMTRDLCHDYSTEIAGTASFGCHWVPEVAGNWKLTAWVAFFYSSGSEPYTYPDGQKVCLQPPLTYEQATIATYDIMVKPISASSTTINASTLSRTINRQTAPISTVELPATLTGVPFRNAVPTTRATLWGVVAVSTLMSLLLFEWVY
ncbi:hypothetical protein FRC19_002159 [Serendipita sp. 401]|nr:hypothetical protein FRC19_002159 [Serendipita sp. 401]